LQKNPHVANAPGKKYRREKQKKISLWSFPSFGLNYGREHRGKKTKEDPDHL